MKLDFKSDMMEEALDFGDDLENDEEANDIYNQVIQEAEYNFEKSMRGEKKASLGQNEYNMNKQKVAIGARNQGNQNKGMRGNYNKNNMQNNNRMNNNHNNDFNKRVLN